MTLYNYKGSQRESKEANIQSVVYGDNSLLFWKSTDNENKRSLRGRFINIKTGRLIGNDFLISSLITGWLVLPDRDFWPF